MGPLGPLRLLHSAPESLATLQQALRGLHSLCDLGVLHPASLPCLIAASLAGNPLAAPHTRSLLLRVVEAAPPLLVHKCSAGMKMAAEHLAMQLGTEASVQGDSWRFAPLCEAYSEFLSDSKQMRDQFITSFMNETISIGNDDASDASQVLLRIQLATGLLMRLPLSREAELAQIFECTIQFLMLKVMPFLAEAADAADATDAGEPGEGLKSPRPSSPSFALVAVATVLHKLSIHWLGLVGSEFARHMQAFAASPNAGRPSATLDLPLPRGFARNELPDFSTTFQHLRSGDNPAKLLLQIPADSPLLAGQAVAQTARRSQKV